MAFCDWLLALAMFSRSPMLCLVSVLRSFSWLDSMSLCGWATFVYASIDGHLSLIPHLPPVNTAARTFMSRCLCRYMLSSSGFKCRSGTAGSRGNSTFNSLRDYSGHTNLHAKSTPPPPASLVPALAFLTLFLFFF